MALLVLEIIADLVPQNLGAPGKKVCGCGQPPVLLEDGYLGFLNNISHIIAIADGAFGQGCEIFPERGKQSILSADIPRTGSI
jgi:hypothetical protein